MLDNSIKYIKDIAAPVVQYEWRTKAYVAPEVADDDQFVAATTLVNATHNDGDWHDLTLVTEYPDVIRGATVTLTDANSSCMAVVELKGYDQFGNHQKEIIRTVPGTNTVKGTGVWSRVTSARVKIFGTITGGGVDTLKVGTSNRLGLPVQLVEDTDLVYFVSDTAAAKVDEVANWNATPPTADLNVQYSWMEPATAPDGTKVFWCEIRPQIPEAGASIEARPRLNIITG